MCAPRNAGEVLPGGAARRVWHRSNACTREGNALPRTLSEPTPYLRDSAGSHTKGSLSL